MDNFWKWLKKANARAVFGCLLAALLAVTAWWAWKLTTPIRMPPPPGMGTVQPQITPGLGVIAYLQAQQVAGTNRAANLFTPAESATQSSSPKVGKTDPANPPPQPEPHKDPGKSTPEHIKKTVTLTYRGLYVRGDGIPVALIADSHTKRTAFYTAGVNLFGVKLTTIEAETLGVTLPDQSTVALKRGVPQSFPEDNHAD